MQAHSPAQPKMPPNLSRAPVLVSFLLLLRSLLSTAAAASLFTDDGLKTFIVIVDHESKPYPFLSHATWYSSLVSAGPAAIHTLYETLVHGFSATLPLTLARRIENFAGVLAVREDYVLRLHTTRSPSFLHLDPLLSPLSNLSRLRSDSIVGVIDTGVWPESPSFSDHDISPIPEKWTGECEIGERFNRSHCNRKLIGARYFAVGYSAAFGDPSVSGTEFLSARDSDGHGTHVASIAAGSPVVGANFNGFAGGVARGMAPRARIAVYKVYWALGCLVSDIVSAIEKAVSDGVDVISLSLGSSSLAESYYLDPLAIATFRATLRGVFIAASAGNDGPVVGSVANAPPWITTVGAATIDRDFPAVVCLGNGEILRGISISTTPRKKIRGKLTGRVPINSTSSMVRDRIVFVEAADRHVSRIETGDALRRAGAAAMIIFNGDRDPSGLVAEPHVIPTVAVGLSDAKSIERYIRDSKRPPAEIFSEGTNLLPHGTAPVVASFSSRGPNPAVPWVLKPDLVGPGVSILGAWTGEIGPSGLESDNRRPGFNIMSGTSMACPHVSGVAALIRSARPDWGPSEVRSALMTTAASAGLGRAGPFGFGSGYLAPNEAADPGLVYDLEYGDYAAFLCGLGYKEEEIEALAGRRGGARCARLGGKGGVWGFNYPGFVVEEGELAGNGEVVFYRRLKRVDEGKKGSWYRADVAGVEGYSVEVVPRRLWFNGSVGERLEFRLVLRRLDGGKRKRREKRWGSGALRWREEKGRHSVRSPIVVFSKEMLKT